MKYDMNAYARGLGLWCFRDASAFDQMDRWSPMYGKDHQPPSNGIICGPSYNALASFYWATWLSIPGLNKPTPFVRLVPTVEMDGHWKPSHPYFNFLKIVRMAISFSSPTGFSGMTYTKSPLVRKFVVVSSGTGDTELGPTKMDNMDAGGLDLRDELIHIDYDYQCAANLGPCNYEYCNMDCCIRQCNNYYAGLHPRPYCEDWGARYKYKLCKTHQEAEGKLDNMAKSKVKFESRFDVREFKEYTIMTCPYPKKRHGPPSAPLIAAAAPASLTNMHAKKPEPLQHRKSTTQWSVDKEGELTAEKLDLEGEKTMESARTLLSIGFEIKPC
ncbi:hypothetical protein RND71_042160 [Anisodus tanguticus]|uniref:Uncharacterized protein n=1 Tax=Anisodus tanguticus TaxID=243964 RepID=A0AAE1UMS4_9SOLA|nr:hypothetical protein RND71_042160 [Anisodus tanguticus]